MIKNEVLEKERERESYEQWGFFQIVFGGGRHSRKKFHAAFREERKLEAKLACCLSGDYPGMVPTISSVFSVISCSSSFFHCF